MRAFVEARIKPYYLHHPDLAPGTAHFRLPIAEGQARCAEMRGRVSGLAQPAYVLDIPGGYGKISLLPEAARRGDGAMGLTDPAGRVVRATSLAASLAARPQESRIRTDLSAQVRAGGRSARYSRSSESPGWRHVDFLLALFSRRTGRDFPVGRVLAGARAKRRRPPLRRPPTQPASDATKSAQPSAVALIDQAKGQLDQVTCCASTRFARRCRPAGAERAARPRLRRGADGDRRSDAAARQFEGAARPARTEARRKGDAGKSERHRRARRAAEDLQRDRRGVEARAAARAADRADQTIPSCRAGARCSSAPCSSGRAASWRRTSGRASQERSAAIFVRSPMSRRFRRRARPIGCPAGAGRSFFALVVLIGLLNVPLYRQVRRILAREPTSTSPTGSGRRSARAGSRSSRRSRRSSRSSCCSRWPTRSIWLARGWRR